VPEAYSLSTRWRTSAAAASAARCELILDRAGAEQRAPPIRRAGRGLTRAATLRQVAARRSAPRQQNCAWSSPAVIPVGGRQRRRRRSVLCVLVIARVDSAGAPGSGAFTPSWRNANSPRACSCLLGPHANRPQSATRALTAAGTAAAMPRRCPSVQQQRADDDGRVPAAGHGHALERKYRDERHGARSRRISRDITRADRAVTPAPKDLFASCSQGLTSSC